MDLQDALMVARVVGAALSMGLGAIGPAIGIGLTGSRAAQASARQPAASGEIMKTALIGMAVAESNAIFSLFVAVVLIFVPVANPSWLKIVALISAGLCMGLGSLGPGYGQGYSSARASEGVGACPGNIGETLKLMLIGQAVAGNPAIFALIVSMLLIFGSFPDTGGLLKGAALLGAGLSTGLGAIGPGYGQGFPAGEASWEVSRRPEESSLLTRTMLVGQAVASSTTVYALVISLLLIYFV